jgi:hypothetical protein
VSAKIAVLITLLVTVSGAATEIAAYPPSSLAQASKIPDGKIYKSPNHIFTIVVPQPSGFDHSGWEVSYESKSDHQMVTFAVYDFAQTYRAGVAEIAGAPPDLDTLAQHAVVSRQHQIGQPVELIEETKVSTQFGEGTLRLYSMKGGSLD